MRTSTSNNLLVLNNEGDDRRLFFSLQALLDAPCIQELFYMMLSSC